MTGDISSWRKGSSDPDPDAWANDMTFELKGVSFILNCICCCMSSGVAVVYVHLPRHPDH